MMIVIFVRPVLVAVALLLCAPACGSGQSGEDVPTGRSDPVDSVPPASPTEWGPLTVLEGPPSVAEAVVSGTVTISDDCVTIKLASDEQLLLVWPSEGTSWDHRTGGALFRAGESEVRVIDGNRASFTGGALTDPGTVSSSERRWVVRPREACPSEYFFIGSVARL